MARARRLRSEAQLRPQRKAWRASSDDLVGRLTSLLEKRLERPGNRLASWRQYCTARFLSVITQISEGTEPCQ